ncbi:hypothetical protein OH77DRAFT_627171 [Trametes cingulata]|nr:hypothetical protein OH77DRAFT_627171 [Trametes cingulata]
MRICGSIPGPSDAYRHAALGVLALLHGLVSWKPLSAVPKWSIETSDSGQHIRVSGSLSETLCPSSLTSIHDHLSSSGRAAPSVISHLIPSSRLYLRSTLRWQRTSPHPAFKCSWCPLRLAMCSARKPPPSYCPRLILRTAPSRTGKPPRTRTSSWMRTPLPSPAPPVRATRGT